MNLGKIVLFFSIYRPYIPVYCFLLVFILLDFPDILIGELQKKKHN